MGDEGTNMEVDRAIAPGTSTDELLLPDLQVQTPEQATLIDADEVELLPEDSNLESEIGLESSTVEPYSELSPEVESSHVAVGGDAVGSTLQTADLASEADQLPPDGLPPNGFEESILPDDCVPPPVYVLQERITLKNARVGVEFHEPLGIDGLEGLRVEQPVIDSGLRIDWAEGVLCGTPTVPGDFEWKVKGRRDGANVEIVFCVAVIPDPKSLWKNLPSNRQDGFWKVDEVAEVLDGEIYCVAASKRGRSHAHDGGFRDDHFDMTTTGPGGWHVVAVADGAGSAKSSRQGSKVAVEYVIRDLPGKMATAVGPRLNEIVALCEADPEGNAHAIRTILYHTLVDVAFGAAKAVEREAKNREHDPGDYSTTMIMAAVTKIEGGWFIASFSVGDGGAAILELEANQVTVMTTPDSGEFAGQTRFLRSSEFSDPAKSMERIHFAVRPNFTAMALLTDGITDPKFPTDVSFSQFDHWKSFWIDDLTAAVDFTRGNGEVASAQLLAWMDFWSDGNHDDRTIAIILP